MFFSSLKKAHQACGQNRRKLHLRGCKASASEMWSGASPGAILGLT